MKMKSCFFSLKMGKWWTITVRELLLDFDKVDKQCHLTNLREARDLAVFANYQKLFKN